MVNQYFFMVFVEGGESPTYRHFVQERAEEEAKRLAKLTGKQVFVLCSLKSFEVNEFLVKDYRPSVSDLPF